MDILVDLLVEGAHGGFGYGGRNPEGDKILEFGDATKMVVADTLVKKIGDTHTNQAIEAASLIMSS